MTIAISWLIALATLAAPPAAALAADAWPARPVRLIVPFPPGGSNDIVGRVIGAKLTERLGKQVVIDNRAGAAGAIGTEIAVNAQPDGYTLLVISAAHAYGSSMRKTPFHPLNSITPVAMLGSGPTSLAVHPSVPVKSVKDLIALAKSKPGQLNYSTAGVGSFQHLSSEMFRVMAGINAVHIPFKGGGPAMASVIAGQAQYVIGTIVQTLPFIKNGKLKVLGIGGAQRNPVLPDVPTIAEAGVPGYEASNWWGIVGPVGLPAGPVKRVSAEVSAVLAQEETRKWFISQGAQAVDKGPVEFRKWIGSEIAKWSRVVSEAGLKAE
jgi:tripartite-type tricarboxylate transporter receptor subunit TctC